MGSVKNIKPKVPEIVLLGEKFEFKLTMLGNEFLAGVYGTAKKAYQKLIDLSKAMTAADGLPAEAYDILLNFIHAGILHNKYDADGELTDRKVPTVNKLKMNLSDNDIIPLANALMTAQTVSSPDPVEKTESEEKPKNPILI